MLVDTHAHLNMPPLSDHWLEVMDQAYESGVERVVVPGASLESSRIAVQMASEDVRIFAAVGVHPESTDSVDDLGIMIKELKNLAKQKRVVAIGECGLDYFRGEENREEQKKLFKVQVELARDLRLPIIIHTRTNEAMTDAFEILKGSLDFTRDDKIKIVFHCFSGDLDFWRRIEPLGAMVGVGATITYPKNESLREVIQQIPLERIVMETDAPWLPPQLLRGQINTPANVTISACKLAEVKQIQLSKVLEITSNNANRLFGGLIL